MQRAMQTTAGIDFWLHSDFIRKTRVLEEVRLVPFLLYRSASLLACIVWLATLAGPACNARERLVQADAAQHARDERAH